MTTMNNTREQLINEVNVMKYRNKQTVIEAVQWTGLNIDEVKSFVGESLHYGIINTKNKDGECETNVNMTIKTSEGNHFCTKGDFIIKGVNGEFYLCKPDIFEKTYEEASSNVNEKAKAWYELKN